MGQNITLMGASYTDVEQVALPKTGSGTASFADPSGVTAVASDVASGKYFLTALGVLTQGTASGGGGGASNVVIGKFKGTTGNKAMDISLSYSGTGYPIAVLVFPTVGSYNNASGSNTFYLLVQRYAMQMYSAAKCRINEAPQYTGTSPYDTTTAVIRYKNSTSSATSYTEQATSSNPNGYKSTLNATNSTAACLVFKSATTMSVYICSSSYGFAVNIEYTYIVLYSS